MWSRKQHFLMHYASPYYDPQKAHEYYEKHKQLKGNTRSTSDLSEEGKKVWAVTKEGIKNEKTEKVKAEKESANTKVAKHRESAKATRERITQQLKALSEKLSTSLKSDVARIQNSNMSSAEKKAKIAQLREQNASEKSSASEGMKAERERVSTELKGVISATREAYKQAKAGLDESYEKIYQSEFDKIKAQMPNTKKKKSRKNKST